MRAARLRVMFCPAMPVSSAAGMRSANRARNLYAFYTARQSLPTPFLCAGFYSARHCMAGEHSVDFVYLLLIFVLAAAGLGFLLICDRLGRR